MGTEHLRNVGHVISPAAGCHLEDASSSVLLPLLVGRCGRCDSLPIAQRTATGQAAVQPRRPHGRTGLFIPNAAVQ